MTMKSSLITIASRVDILMSLKIFIFRGHPLGHSILGTAERVRKFSTEDALRFTQKHYQPMNSVFFAYGDVDFDNLISLLEKENHSKVRIKGETEKPIETQLPALSEYQPTDS